MRTNGTYRTPVHGVSTLAPRNRMRGQAEQQINFRSDPVNKLSRRPSTIFKGIGPGILSGADASNCLLHTYTRNGKEYVYIFREFRELGGNLQCTVQLRIDGALVRERLINCGPYGKLKENFKIVTIGDTTFVVNRKQVVQSIEVEDSTPVVSYLNVISALNYGEEIKFSIRVALENSIGTITFNMVYIVPDLGDPPDYDTADKARATNAVAEAIANQVNLQVNQPFKAVHKGSVVAIVQDESHSETIKELVIEVETGQGSRSVIATNNTNQDIEGLPLFGLEGSHITVKPRPTSDRGTYYLRADKVNDEIETGQNPLTEVVWVETRSKKGNHKLDADTLPITLVVENDDYTVEIPEWEERQTGDDKTNKVPAFVGRTIQDVATHQNRLIILSSNTISMSRTDNLYNFFRESVVRLMVTDPISVSSSSTNSDVLQHVVNHNRDLMINSSSGQFKIDGNVAVTPETVSLPQVTAYTCQVGVPPVAFGNAVLFPMTYGASSGILIYNKDAQVESDKATQISNHVQGLMQGDVTVMDADSTLEMCVVKTSNSPPNTLYVYEQYTEFDEARQRSWSVWEFNGVVRDCKLIKNKLVVLLQRGTLVIEEIILNTRIANDDDRIFLDNKMELTVQKLTNFDALYVELPLSIHTFNELKVVYNKDAQYPLSEVKISQFSSGNRLNIDNSEYDYIQEGDTVIVGTPFRSSYIPTRPFRWTEAGQVVTTDKLRVSRFTLSLVDSADVSMSIKSEIYPEETQEFNSRIVGGLNNLVGVQPFTTGDVQFSFSKEADLAVPEFFTEGYLPLTIAGISWFGQYHEPSRRM